MGRRVEDTRSQMKMRLAEKERPVRFGVFRQRRMEVHTTVKVMEDGWLTSSKGGKTTHP
uniref:Uncharacterized protein n=1 Tax=Cucumis melo TaxID=3656 RepID=A0A9I9CFK7_CUCME